MKTAHTILLDLLSGQATTAAIADHLQQPPTVLAAFISDLETDGLVTAHTIAGGFLTAWRITPAGRQLTETLLQPA